MDIFFTILILILVVALSGIVTRILPFQLPLPLMQIALGTLIAWPDIGFHVDFDPELFLVLFIPPLLFADGRKTPLREFLHHGREIFGLAMMLVFITVVGLGYLIHWIIPEMPLVVSFALAAVLSPTDAVALSGIVGEGRIPKSIMSILQGEALMNDASGLVSLKFALMVAVGAMVFESASDYSNAGLMFVKVALGGVLVGVAVTWLYTKSLRFISRWNDDDPATQIMLLLLLPFVAYVVAEQIGVSGILAAVAAGMTIGQSGVINSAPLAMRLRANSVWKMLEFTLNGTVFLMLGLQIPGIIKTSMKQLAVDGSMTPLALVIDILWIYFALMTVRFLWLWSMRSISNHFLKRRPLTFGSYSLKELLIATFAGVRGAITLAGALSIPLLISEAPNVPFPARYQVIFLAAGVILFSLICGVIMLPMLLKGVLSTDRATSLAEEQLAKAAMAEVAIISLQKLEERISASSEENVDPQLLTEISSQVIGSLRRHSDVQEKQDAQEASEHLERRFRLTALRAERGELYHLRATQKISNETLDRLIYDLDLMETILIGQETKN